MVEMLTELNSRNPQVASRLIEPLIRLKRYDAKRQAKMRALEQLKGLENLSGDLYEKIAKALSVIKNCPWAGSKTATSVAVFSVFSSSCG
jgi:hypothetical protein